MARLYFAIVIYGLAALLLFTVAAVRDQSVIDHFQPRPDPVECVAERYAAGATYLMAVELCGGLTPDRLERDLP